MQEFGGYIELDRYSLPLLHDGAIALNCARNACPWCGRDAPNRPQRPDA